jgi:hypothetical protein
VVGAIESCIVVGESLEVISSMLGASDGTMESECPLTLSSPLGTFESAMVGIMDGDCEAAAT